jgi:hypothetical protein
MPEFFRLLSQPVQLEEASRRLGVDYGAISNWLMRFRQLIARHDADLHWTALVRLGLKYRPHGACPKCRHEGQLNNGGFTADNRRQANCWILCVSAHAVCPSCMTFIHRTLARSPVFADRLLGQPSPVHNPTSPRARQFR